MLPGPPGASARVPLRATGTPETTIVTVPTRLPSPVAAPQVCVSTTLRVSPTMFLAKSGRSSDGRMRSVVMTVLAPDCVTSAEYLIAAVAAHFGQVDAVVNSASTFEHDNAGSFGFAAMEQHLRANTGAAIVSREKAIVGGAATTVTIPAGAIVRSITAYVTTAAGTPAATVAAESIG